MRAIIRAACIVVIVGTAASGLQGQTRAPDPLADGFRNPPDVARPRVWWHWMDGNITKEGIKRDLEWLHRVGIRGVTLFDAALGGKAAVDKRLVYMTPEWQDAVRYAVDLADRLGIETTIATSAGWSETGGPWVKPADAMKKLVWSEVVVEGGTPLSSSLPHPPTVNGPFQQVALTRDPFTGQDPPSATFYADAKVVAYRLSDADAEPAPAKVSIPSGPIEGAGLADGVIADVVQLPAPSAEPTSWVRFDYGQPVTVRGVTVALSAHPRSFFDTSPQARLEVSDDGTAFRTVSPVVAGPFNEHTTALAPVAARTFRVVFLAPAPSRPPAFLSGMAPGAALPFPPGGAGAGSAQTLPLAELVLHTGAVVHRFEEKAGFATVPDYYAIATPPVEPALAIAKDGVVDLTARLRPDGTLYWTPPTGRWRIIRLGYSLTGHKNGPAPAEASGFEVDKLSRPRVHEYMDTYLQSYEAMLGPSMIGQHGVTSTLSDSIEAGAQNWTDDILEQFAARRGYSPVPFLPALTGHVVESAEASDRFLCDFRRTIVDLLAESHYAQVTASAHRHGLRTYGEALEDNRPSLGDDMAMRSYADIPMGAMWTMRPDAPPVPTYAADLRGAASVAHVYGRPLVAAESMTSALAPWAHAPRDLKRVADLEFALGVNRVVIHSSVHQPLLDKAPGLTLFIFGQYFNRNETWAEQAKPWIDYLARTSYMLQQGRFQADVAYFYGEEAPLTGLYGAAPVADAPAHYGYDFVNADVVLHQLAVEDGWLTTPSGMRYRALQLGGSSSRMTLPVLRRIAALVEAGGVVVGARPLSSPSLADDARAYAELTDRLWGPANSPGGRGVGRGRVIAGQPIEAALALLGLAPDFEALDGGPAPPLMVLHRHLPDGDVYFVTNRKNEPLSLEMAFRATGREAEQWDAVTGDRRPMAYRIDGDRTVVPLALEGDGSALIVFRTAARATSRTVASPAERVAATLDAGWTVTFEAGRGAPSSSDVTGPGSWTESRTPGVKYFSGTAAYRTTWTLDERERADGARVILDLGDVHEIAEVVVNGRSVRTLWQPPYRVDITDALKAGPNALELRVTNLWVNRLIGDAQPGAERVTFTVSPPYQASAPLRPSGLLGPVRVVIAHAAR
jgi:(4-O-methyl)-D-glucuronate---lignin esterase